MGASHGRGLSSLDDGMLEQLLARHSALTDAGPQLGSPEIEKHPESPGSGVTNRNIEDHHAAGDWGGP